ncbi:hypothetical protein SS50377_25319 [Spironucleus salmonicida]|uniref:Uncharacterized protein n=1 Tax=Spironucleus salmonicida TaxID=348837 RepID=V6LDP6_9EUKA|nr:hypothetical protein SS50377_25319 [Spironucleus salmonicida]|eukprot:EST41801.1 Hypothetical protein SS50377_18634 [Spironucleus salmonicida]
MKKILKVSSQVKRSSTIDIKVKVQNIENDKLMVPQSNAQKALLDYLNTSDIRDVKKYSKQYLQLNNFMPLDDTFTISGAHSPKSQQVLTSQGLYSQLDETIEDD